MPAVRNERHGRRRRGTPTERGQATLLVIAVATIVVVLIVAVARLGALVTVVEQAQVAADAAALAAVDGGPAAASRLARANGATVVAFRQEGDEVVVTVDLDGRRATARAARAP
jgi:hypothetical protein